ncbi:MAG: DUF5667 domain-containing protein [Anaerolineae bacterium]|jgi:hypothetical protein
MNEHVSVVLDKALARLEAGEPLEAVLADYPSQRDQLMPLLLVARQLSSLRAMPPPTRSEAGLAAFLEDAQAWRSGMPPRRRWRGNWLAVFRQLRWSPQTRLALGMVVSLLVLFVLVGSTVVLSADSLPGDWLYPVKLAGEEARLVLISGQAARAEYHLLRARTRAEEVRRLVQEGRSVDEITLTRLNQSLEASLLAAASARPEEVPLLLAAIEEMAAEQLAMLSAAETTAITARTYQLLLLARSSLIRIESLARAGRADVHTFRLNATLGVFQSEWLPPSSLETDLPTVTVTPTPTERLPDSPLASVTPTRGGAGDAGERPTASPTATVTARPTATPTPTASVEPSPTPTPSLTPRPSHTPAPPTATATSTPSPAPLTNTEPAPPTRTPEPPTATATAVPTSPPPTNTPAPPPPTNTPAPPPPTNTSAPPPPTNTPAPPPTHTPAPPGQTKTPQPPGQTKTPKPPKP